MTTDHFCIENIELADPDQKLADLQDVCNRFGNLASLERQDDGLYTTCITRPVPIDQAREICQSLDIESVDDSYWPPNRSEITYLIKGKSQRELAELLSAETQKLGNRQAFFPRIYAGEGPDEVRVSVQRRESGKALDTFQFVLLECGLIKRSRQPQS